VRFVADENIDAQIVGSLRALGHEVLYVAEMARGIRDEDVLTLARDRAGILVTGDRDFGTLVFARGLLHVGVVLVRLHGWSPDRKADRVTALVVEHGATLQGAFTVLDERGVRTRNV
jgi:predicted nuclease of predicted toxin-antitoxin system